MANPNQRSTEWLALISALVFPTAMTWIYFVVLAGEASSIQQTIFGIAKVIQFVFPVVWVFLICREKFQWPRPEVQGLAIGSGFGLAILVAMLLLYHLVFKQTGMFDDPAEVLREKLLGFGIDALWKYLALGVFYSLCHSMLEEYYWRWFAYRRLQERTSFGTANLVSSLAFMSHHVILLAVYFGWTSPWTYIFSLPIAVGGGVWAWIYHRSGSLFGPCISHLLVDAGAIYSVPRKAGNFAVWVLAYEVELENWYS